MNYYTADTHFYGSDILTRELRPFDSAAEFALYTTSLWNKRVTNEDVIYSVGDFTNYNRAENMLWLEGLRLASTILAPIVLIVGNNEQRIVDEIYHGDFDRFRTLCLSIGFKDAMYDLTVNIHGHATYLNHYPSKHKVGMNNLFGHTHKVTGLWKPYGLNVGCDLNHFDLYSEAQIAYLMSQKEQWWDKDIDNNCM